MEHRRLGSTDMIVGVIGFGSAGIGAQNIEQHQVTALLNAALDEGLNFIDTAECYEESEFKIGRAIAHRRKDFYLSTKIGHSRDWDMPDWNSPAILAATITESLRRLRTDHLDIVHLHGCPLEELHRGAVIEVLQAARHQGKVRYIGYSGDGAPAQFAARSGLFDVLQISISIADQGAIAEVLPHAQEANVGVIAKRPLANVAWANVATPSNPYHRPYWRRLKELDYEFLRSGAVTPASVAIALRFTLGQYVHVAIVGTRNGTRYLENIRLMDAGGLHPDILTQIRNRWEAVAEASWDGQT